MHVRSALYFGKLICLRNIDIANDISILNCTHKIPSDNLTPIYASKIWTIFSFKTDTPKDGHSHVPQPSLGVFLIEKPI